MGCVNKMAKRKKSYKKSVSRLSPVTKGGVRAVTLLTEATLVLGATNNTSKGVPYEQVLAGDIGNGLMGYLENVTTWKSNALIPVKIGAVLYGVNKIFGVKGIGPIRFN